MAGPGARWVAAGFAARLGGGGPRRRRPGGRRRGPRAAVVADLAAVPAAPAALSEAAEEEEAELRARGLLPRPEGGEAAEEPLTRASLGRATWGLLHTMAASYPERPTRGERRAARQIVHALAALYPCEECAAHFREVLAADPPETASREAFSGWLCRVHNVVNRSLDKPAFDCARADLRWSPLACTVGEKAACRRGGVP